MIFVMTDIPLFGLSAYNQKGPAGHRMKAVQNRNLNR
jgi:hypothetical protein